MWEAQLAAQWVKGEELGVVQLVALRAKREVELAALLETVEGLEEVQLEA